MSTYYKKKPTPETLLKRDIKNLLRTLGIFNFPVLQGLGATPGIPDILGIYKGRFVGIECKAPGGKPSEHQKRFLEIIREQGGIAILAYSVSDVIEGLGVQDRFLDFQPEQARK